MSYATTKFVRVGPESSRHVEAATPLGRAVLHVLDTLSLGMIGDLLAARGMRLNHQQLLALVDQARRAAAGDPSVRLDPHAETAYEILSRLNVPRSVRQKFTPLHAEPADPGRASGVAYEAGLNAILRGVSGAEPGGISRMVPWLRQQSLPVDHFLAMPVTGLRLVQPDGYGRMRPVPGRTATMNDLLNMRGQTTGPASARWTVADEAAVRRSIQDAVHVLRGAMGHNARVETICRALDGAITASAMTAGAVAVGGMRWLSATLPDAPDADQIRNLALQSAQSPYHVPLESGVVDPDGVRRRQMPDATMSPGGERWSPQSGSWHYAPSWQNASPEMSGRPPVFTGTPAGWAGSPSPQQPLPTQPEQVQAYDLQVDDWLTGREGGANMVGKFTPASESQK